MFSITYLHFFLEYVDFTQETNCQHKLIGFLDQHVF